MKTRIRKRLAGGDPAALPKLADAPLSWQSFFVRALSLDPARRPESTGAFLSELEQALDS